MSELKYAEAIRAGIDAEMANDERVVLLGEEVGALGGVFTVTRGLLERYGPERVLDSPIAEGGLVGFAIGAATQGLRPVVEIMFSDFVFLALDQLVNLGAKLSFMSNGQFNVPLVVRMPGGAGTNHGPQHSQSLESMFAQIPGLVVAMPSTASDAYWMTREAIRCDDPVVVLESKYLYFRSAEEVDESEGPRGLGARVVREGSAITLVSAGRMTHRCLDAATVLARSGIEIEVIDLRYLWPLDMATVERSLRKTGRLAVAHEAIEFCGWGGEVVAWASQNCFERLDAPPLRLGSARVPVPFQLRLEDQVIPTAEAIEAQLCALAAY